MPSWQKAPRRGANREPARKPTPDAEPALKARTEAHAEWRADTRPREARTRENRHGDRDRETADTEQAATEKTGLPCYLTSPHQKMGSEVAWQARRFYSSMEDKARLRKK